MQLSRDFQPENYVNFQVAGDAGINRE